MKLFEKDHLRVNMPQANGLDSIQAITKLLGGSVNVFFARLHCCDLEPMQKDTDQAKAERIAADVEKGKELPPIFVSEDGKVLDGHHRWEAVKIASGEDSLIDCYVVALPAVEALEKFKGASSQAESIVREFYELAALACVNGSITKARLLERGFSRDAINRAIRCSLFEVTSGGTLHSRPRHLRKGKILSEFAPAMAMGAKAVAGVGGAAAKGSVSAMKGAVGKLRQAATGVPVKDAARQLGKDFIGQTVGRVVDGKLQKMQVVASNGNTVKAIDLENPAGGVSSENADDLFMSSNDPEDQEDATIQGTE